MILSVAKNNKLLDSVLIVTGDFNHKIVPPNVSLLGKLQEQKNKKSSTKILYLLQRMKSKTRKQHELRHTWVCLKKKSLTWWVTGFRCSELVMGARVRQSGGHVVGMQVLMGIGVCSWVCGDRRNTTLPPYIQTCHIFINYTLWPHQSLCQFGCICMFDSYCMYLLTTWNSGAR